MMRAVLLMTVLLGGCAAPTLLDLEPPAASLMRAPKKIPDAKAGEDIGVNNLKIRHVCSVEISKLTRLQRYVKTVISKGDK